MRTITFIAVVIVFTFILIYKRSSKAKGNIPVAANAVSSRAPEHDEYIKILAFNPKEEKNAQEFGSSINEEIETALNWYLCRDYLCNVEFVTVGLCLVVVIRARTTAGSKRKRGIEKIWNRQSAEMRIP